MKRVLVIGCPGSGKSTFAHGLATKTGLPLHYLDMLYWNADKTTVSREEFDRRLDEILACGEWIIDGNYGRTMERRLEACDTVFFFDLPTEVCINGVYARQGKPRPDMPWVETEDDEEFLDYIRRFKTEQVPGIFERIEKFRDGREIHIFRSHADADEYLAMI